MDGSRCTTDVLRAVAAAWLFALSVAAGCGASAHGGEEHSEAAPAKQAFAIPEPGSYALPPLGPAADGEILSAEGEATRLHDLFGDGVVLLSFVYTQCSDAEGCPLATAVLHRVGARLGAERELLGRLRLISLSFDPERDTPEVMRRYGEGFQRPGLDWRFATTDSEAALAPILSAYRQTRVREVDAGGQETGKYAHLLRVFLIDEQRRIRQVYSTGLLDEELLVADVHTLILESQRGPRRAAVELVPPSLAPGDDRRGYEVADYTTRSLALEARRGRGMDLIRRLSPPPLGLPSVPVPERNPLTTEKVELGRRLFFDRRLSHNDTISCAMCHVPEQGFTSNEMATSVGVEGRTVRRNAPTIYNSAYFGRLFHDGRETSLEQQVWGPLLARNEMANPSIGALLEKLGRLDDYAARFAAAFPERGLSAETLGMALASYERTLVSGGSAFDRAIYGGEKEALSPSARRGMELFTGRAGCLGCHPMSGDSALFSDGGFHNTGVGYRAAMGGAAEGAGSTPSTQRVQAAPGVYLDVPRAIIAKVSERPANDLGRYEITRDPADRWRYRTPTLRNVALTAPYMHDGSLSTLRDVVSFYDSGGVANEGLDPLIRPLGLGPAEIDDLVAFLESLTGADVDVLVADAFAAPVGDAGATP
jgi:cytochrome c peroxidase